MGNYLFSKPEERIPPIVQLCNDYVDDDVDFMIIMRIHTNKPFNERHEKELIDYLQYTNPTLIKIKKRSVFMLYNQNNKASFLRSNIVADIISNLSSELAMWIIKNTTIDLRMISVSISTGAYVDLLNKVNELTKYETI